MWLTLFVVSLFVNIVLLFYVRWLLKSVVSINQDMENINVLVSDFSNHLTSVHELEMFYGDETLVSLMNHSRELTEKLKGLDLILNNEQQLETEEDQEAEVAEKS